MTSEYCHKTNDFHIILHAYLWLSFTYISENFNRKYTKFGSFSYMLQICNTQNERHANNICKLLLPTAALTVATSEHT
jgi:hypothetical protein